MSNLWCFASSIYQCCVVKRWWFKWQLGNTQTGKQQSIVSLFIDNSFRRCQWWLQSGGPGYWHNFDVSHPCITFTILVVLTKHPIVAMDQSHRGCLNGLKTFRKLTFVEMFAMHKHPPCWCHIFSLFLLIDNFPQNFPLKTSHTWYLSFFLHLPNFLQKISPRKSA